MVQTKRNGVLFFVGVIVVGMVSGCGGGDSSDEESVALKPKSTETKAEGKTTTQTTDEPTTPAGIGSLHGVIKYDGPPPHLAPLVKKGAPIKEPYCATTTVPDDSLVVASDGGIANVFIYLTKTPKHATIPPVPTEPAVFDQEHCRFKPHALVCRVGQIVMLKNSDGVAHNTHLNPISNTGMNAVIPPNGANDFEYVYKKRELKPIRVNCDIHAWMKAWHLPLDHPYGAVTAEDGSFTINDLPAGVHEFRIWHEKVKGFLNRRYKVTIKPDETTEVSISYKPEKFGK